MAAEPRPIPKPSVTELIALLDGIATSLVWVDADGAIVHLNEPAEDLFGLSRNQAHGRALHDLLKSNTELEGVVTRARAAAAQYSRREIPFEAGPGAPPRVLDVTVTPFDFPGRPSGALVELADTTHHQRITRENNLLTQLGGSRAMVRQLAHEIKNPLGGLRGAAQLLERQLKEPALHEYTAVIIAEADRLAALVDSLLGPGQPPHKEAVNIHEIVQHVGHLLAAEAPTGVQIERDYDPSLPRMRLDRNQIIQALLNLGRNAIQAVGERGRIVLRTRAADQREHRQPSLSRGRRHPGRGRRTGRPGRTQGHGVLPAGDRPQDRHRARAGRGAGPDRAPRWPDRIRQSPGSNCLHDPSPLRRQ